MAKSITILGQWLCIAVLAASCTGSADDAGPSEDASETSSVPTSAGDEPTTSTSSDDSGGTTSSTESPVADSASESDSDQPSPSVGPLSPAGDPPPTVEGEFATSAWISRTEMTAENITVQWSTTDGASDYFIHRVVRTSESEPGPETMTDENRIHAATDFGRYTDAGVEADTRYWHGIRAISSDGDLLAYGWHKTAAVDDEEPPSTIPGLTATVTDQGEVLVSWLRPDENYELHGYRILRGVDDEEPEAIATTWRLDQLSLIDDEVPESGEVVYEVVAFDFHWNDSRPARVAIDLS